METKEIKELMLSGEIVFSKNTVNLYKEDLNGNSLVVYSRPKDDRFVIIVKDYKGYVINLTDEEYNMICKYVESEFNEYHSNNSAFTDEDKEHFNSLI